MEENKMKKTAEPRSYSQEELLTYAESYVRAAHNSCAREEQRYGEKLYTTFGEWKKKNPDSPIAKKNYPENEFVEVIAAYKSYFDKRYAEDIIDAGF